MSDKIPIMVEEVFALQKRRKEINKLPLRKIIWTKNKKPIVISKETIENWELTGLSNIDFIISGEFTAAMKDDNTLL